MKDKIKNILDITFWKFVLVGIVNTLVGTAVMFAAYNVLHLSYWISSASNYVVGSIVSYFLNKYFTFQNKEKSWKQLVKFALNITVCYLVAYGLAKPLVSWFLHIFIYYILLLRCQCHLLFSVSFYRRDISASLLYPSTYFSRRIMVLPV